MCHEAVADDSTERSARGFVTDESILLDDEKGEYCFVIGG